MTAVSLKKKHDEKSTGAILWGHELKIPVEKDDLI